jgi:hypothetical protein
MKTFTRLPLAILMIFLFVYVIIDINAFLISKEGTTFLGNLNTYSNLILSLLTFLLVLITGFYVLVTNQILAQMIEEKQSAIRPIFWVSLDKPKFQESSYPEDESMYFNLKARISNYGKGSAVEVQTTYSIPHEWDEGDKFAMPVSTSRTHPALLAPGDSIEDTLNISTRIFDIKNIYPDYLRVNVLYEDTERNLYQMQQSYYLLVAPGKPTMHYLHLESESLYIISFKNRKHLAIDESLNSDKKTRLFKREKPWKWERSKAKHNIRRRKDDSQAASKGLANPS